MGYYFLLDRTPLGRNEEESEFGSVATTSARALAPERPHDPRRAIELSLTLRGLIVVAGGRLTALEHPRRGPRCSLIPPPQRDPLRWRRARPRDRNVKPVDMNPLIPPRRTAAAARGSPFAFGVAGGGVARLVPYPEEQEELSPLRAGDG